MEPDFLAQTGDLDFDDKDAVQAWIKKTADDARAKGTTWQRVSWSEEHRLVLLEGWKVRPDEEGDPRFQLVPLTPSEAKE